LQKNLFALIWGAEFALKTVLENSIKGSRTAGIKLNVWIKICTFYVLANSSARAPASFLLKGKASFKNSVVFMKLKQDLGQLAHIHRCLITYLIKDKLRTLYQKKNLPEQGDFDLKLISKQGSSKRCLKLKKKSKYFQLF